MLSTTFTNYIFHGIDTFCTFVEELSVNTFVISFENHIFNIFSSDWNLYLYSIWYISLSFSETSLLWSVILDDFFAASLLENEFFENFFEIINNPFDFEEEYEWYYDLPDFLQIHISYINDFVSECTSYLYYGVSGNNSEENPITLPKIIIDVLFLIIILYVFLSMYFSYYGNSTKEYNLIDHDYLLTSITVEAEEEISSWDDMILALLILVFSFFWYFGINILMIISNSPEFYLSFYIFPFLYYIIMLIPAFLAYDFGIYFVSYLRGKGDSTVSIVELMYDYIAFASFYIRLIVQNVRLLLMAFTFASFHEIILIHEINRSFLLGDETFSEIFSSSSYTFAGACFHFIIKIASHIIYFFYELFHLLFVVTAQIIAFHAMVFWLFLFLYTMFSAELHEKFFFQKRLLYKIRASKYTSFKSKFI